DPTKSVQTRSQLSSNALACFYSKVQKYQNRFFHSCFISQVEPRSYKEELKENSWANAMQEELQQFEKLLVWHIVDLWPNTEKIGTKWVFKCNKDEM
ncbi:MAG: hypothetical protein Q8755_02790, partial [Candidatus Phytoplasma australasiaticum]|nr:hypothetical protein [Candidatus Phytoplasma australasiaticum]